MRSDWIILGDNKAIRVSQIAYYCPASWDEGDNGKGHIVEGIKVYLSSGNTIWLRGAEAARVRKHMEEVVKEEV